MQSGHRVVFLARRQPGESNRETIAGVEVVKMIGLRRKCRSLAEYLVDYTTFFWMTMLHLLRHPRRYDLIHINNMPDFLVFAAWLPRALGRPVIHDVHDLMPELYHEKFGTGKLRWVIRALEAQERWAGQFATSVLTVEERLKDILARRGIRRDKIHVLMNLPDERIFSPRTAPESKPDDAPFVLVYHGTLARRLGLDIAIRAVARARSSIPRLALRIIGAGEERERLIALRNELGMQDAVTFSTGFVPVEAIPAMLADADVGVVPLRISSGTDIMLPTKLLEYVALGIPCIVPRTGTVARYFTEDMVQFFVAEDVDSLSDAIIALYRDQGRRIRLSEEATERFARIYSWTEHKKVYTSLVEALLPRQSAPAQLRSGSEDRPIPK